MIVHTFSTDEGDIAIDIQESLLGRNQTLLHEGVLRRDRSVGNANRLRPDIPIDLAVPEGFHEWHSLKNEILSQLHGGASRIFVDETRA